MASHRSTKGASRKSAILVLARQQLIDAGYDELVLRNLADSLGMRLGNLQYYFSTKDALVEAVVRAEAETDLADLKQFCTDEPDPETGFRAFVDHIVAKWRSDSGLILGIMGYLAMHKPAFRQMYREIYNEFYSELAGLIGCLDPGLTDAECLHRARLITALLDGASVQLQRRRDKTLTESVAAMAFQIAVGSSGDRS